MRPLDFRNGDVMCVAGIYKLLATQESKSQSVVTKHLIFGYLHCESGLGNHNACKKNVSLPCNSGICQTYEIGFKMVDHLPVVVTVVLIVPIYGPYTTAVLRVFSYHCSYIAHIIVVRTVVITVGFMCDHLCYHCCCHCHYHCCHPKIGIYTDEYLHCPQIISFSWVLSL